MNDEQKTKRTNYSILWIHFIIWTAVIVCVILLVSDLFGLRCNGEKEWDVISGELIKMNIDCEQCCHPSSWFKVKHDDNKTREYWINNCDTSLNSISTGETYTFYIEPCMDQYQISQPIGEPTCYWTRCLGEIKTMDGVTVWGGGWL